MWGCHYPQDIWRGRGGRELIRYLTCKVLGGMVEHEVGESGRGGGEGERFQNYLLRGGKALVIQP